MSKHKQKQNFYFENIYLNLYLPICELTDGGGYIKGFADPIIDGT